MPTTTRSAESSAWASASTNPSLGPFLEVDPVEGGSANDYDYVAGDPINRRDLDGTRMCVDNGGCRRSVVKSTSRPRRYCPCQVTGPRVTRQWVRVASFPPSGGLQAAMRDEGRAVQIRVRDVTFLPGVLTVSYGGESQTRGAGAGDFTFAFGGCAGCQYRDLTVTWGSLNPTWAGFPIVGTIGVDVYFQYSEVQKATYR